MYTPDCSLVRPSPLAHALARDLSRELPTVRSSASEVDRVSYARDLWPRHHLATRSGEGAASSPAVVVWPSSTAEVASVVRFAAQRGTPLIPFGAGSGVCGGVLPSPDAIVLDLKRLGRVRSVNGETMTLDVEAGVLGLPLEEELERRGLTLGHFPSSILCSTVGGWVATRSAGQSSGYYGKIEDMVVALECVTGTGEIVALARRRSGPDLSAIVVGSEGALAIVTSSTLRIHAAPKERAFGGLTFSTVAQGLEAMRAMYQAGLRPAVCRLYDPFDANLARSGKVKHRAHGPSASSRTTAWREVAMRAVIARSGALNAIVHGALAGRALGGALLVLVFEGSDEGAAAAELTRARDMARSLGARDEGDGPARRWLAHRYSVSFRQSPALRAGLFIDTFEVAAPWSRLDAVYDAVRHALGAHAFVMAHFSHAYPDGCCIYFSFAGTARPHASARDFEPSSATRYDAAWRDAMTAAIAAGATIAHHHGVGRSKAAGLAREIEGGVAVMRSLKRAFDPHGILNPGVLAAIDDIEPLDVSPPTPAADGFVDETSRLALVRGDRAMPNVVRDLAARGWKLRGNVDASLQLSTDAWLAQGAPGTPDPFADPVDHVVAGIEVALPHGRFVIPPVPRRATGPDFAALAIGAQGAYGARVERAWIRIEPAHEARASSAPRGTPFVWREHSDPSEQERAIVARIARELG